MAVASGRCRLQRRANGIMVNLSRPPKNVRTGEFRCRVVESQLQRRGFWEGASCSWRESSPPRPSFSAVPPRGRLRRCYRTVPRCQPTWRRKLSAGCRRQQGFGSELFFSCGRVSKKSGVRSSSDDTDGKPSYSGSGWSRRSSLYSGLALVLPRGRREHDERHARLSLPSLALSNG